MDAFLHGALKDHAFSGLLSLMSMAASSSGL
jgi:hypothetical protein